MQLHQNLAASIDMQLLQSQLNLIIIRGYASLQGSIVISSSEKREHLAFNLPMVILTPQQKQK